MNSLRNENKKLDKKGNKLVISKKNIKYKEEKIENPVHSRNSKQDFVNPRSNTYSNPITFTSPTHETKPKVEKLFEYKESEEYRFEPNQLDRSDTSISSVFIPPARGAKKHMDRLVKIKEKILNTGNDISHDVNFSSITNGTVMKNSMTTLTMEDKEDSDEEIKSQKNKENEYSNRVNYNQPENKMIKNFS